LLKVASNPRRESYESDILPLDHLYLYVSAGCGFDCRVLEVHLSEGHIIRSSQRRTGATRRDGTEARGQFYNVAAAAAECQRH